MVDGHVTLRYALVETQQRDAPPLRCAPSPESGCTALPLLIVATYAGGITMRYLEMIEADSKTPPVPVLRKLAKVLGGGTYLGPAGRGTERGSRGAGQPLVGRGGTGAVHPYRSIGLGRTD